jgi:GNAT superfamily N-acetyltransferase
MILVRRMIVQDVPLGMHLKEQAGWNQTEADWRRCLELQADGCFVAERNGVPVGTVTTCIFGSIAWIAMVLVDSAWRGQGIGRALLDHALAFLDGRGVGSVRLDATPLGRPLYAKLGFVEEYTLTRYEGVLSTATSRDKITVDEVRPDDLERLLQLDCEITGTERAALLQRLFAESPHEWRMMARGGDVLGFSTARAGSRAWHVGPCVANDEAGPALLAEAFRRHVDERVFVDVPVDHVAAIAAVQGAGLTAQRPLFRMCRGPRPRERREGLWASFGPEKG